MSYLFLGIRYFKNGRTRTVWTIIGVTMVATFLLLGMWIAFSWIDMDLRYKREELGFDLVVKSTDPDLASGLIEDPKISKVTVGSLEDLSYHVESDQTSTDLSAWNNTPVLFVSLKNPKHPFNM